MSVEDKVSCVYVASVEEHDYRCNYQGGCDNKLDDNKVSPMCAVDMSKDFFRSYGYELLQYHKRI